MPPEEINQAGGVLGKKVELIIEDDTGEPSVGIAAAEKLLTRDKVVALIGGYSSTITYAQMNAIQRLEPFVAWAGASSTKVEHEFGPKKWFFHYHPWDYHRQSTIRDFLVSLSPRPKAIAIAYEDGIYGTTSRDYAVKYLKEKGFSITSSTNGSRAAPRISPPCSPRSRRPIPMCSTGWPTRGTRLCSMKQAKELGFQSQTVSLRGHQLSPVQSLPGRDRGLCRRRGRVDSGNEAARDGEVDGEIQQSLPGTDPGVLGPARIFQPHDGCGGDQESGLNG